MTNTPSSLDGSVSSGSSHRGLNRRRLLGSTASGIAGVSLAGCLGTFDSIGGTSTPEETITIGLLAPRPKSNYIGRSMQRSADLAVEKLNENGGIDGTTVELVTGDTHESPLEARREYQRLILEEEADVTVGVFNSSALENIVEEMAEQQTVHITTGAATTAASEAVRDDYERYKYHFRAGPTNNHHLGLAQIDFLGDVGSQIGWESIAVLVEDYPWADRPWELYQNRLEDVDVDVVMDERYPPSTSDFSDLYGEVARSGADAAIVGAAHTGNEALGYWARGEFPFAFGGIHVPMQLPSYYRQTGGLAQYGFGLTSATAQSEFNGTGAFVEDYQRTYDSRPVYTGYHTYDAVNAFARAVESAGTTDSEELVPALEGVSHPGTSGTVEFYGPDADYPHDLKYVEDDTLCFQWQAGNDGNGTQEIIWPEKHKTADYQPPSWL